MTYLSASLIVVQVHEGPLVALHLPGVDELAGEADAEADVGAAAAPLPAGGRGDVADGDGRPGRRQTCSLRRRAPARRYVAPAARLRHGVRHASARDCVRERGLPRT